MNKLEKDLINAAIDRLYPVFIQAEHLYKKKHIHPCLCTDAPYQPCSCPSPLNKSIEESIEFNAYHNLFTAISVLERSKGPVPMQKRKVRK